jgi:prepilin signal peptidase PulO-like enzyme (type II secretory pathway)
MSSPSLASLTAGHARSAASARAAGIAFVALALVVLAFAILPFDRALVCAVTATVLVVLAAIDIERGIIPNRIVLPAAAAVAVMNVALFPGRALEWLLVPLVACVALAIPALVGRNWLGMGDAKLVLLLGAALGWGVVGAVMLAFVCTLPVSALLVIRRGLVARRASLAFGPFLALGALLVMFGPTLAGFSS